MTPDEENLTAAAKYARVMEETMARIAESARIAKAASDKAAANGLSTRAEAKSDKSNINFTTVVAAIGTVFGAVTAVAGVVWWLMGILLAPQQKQMDRIEAVQVKQAEAQVALQLDVRALYAVSNTQKSERLEKPPVIPLPEDKVPAALLTPNP